MNCKQGDLAWVTKSIAGNEGKIVRCMELVSGGGALGIGPRWITEPVLLNEYGCPHPPLDRVLRPIRGGEGQDEMLRIAGSPAPLHCVA